MEARRVLKRLRDLADEELQGKKADRVIVCRAKLKSMMRRGRVPGFQVRGAEWVRYVVCVFREKELTVHFLDNGGAMLGATEFTGAAAEKEWQSISMDFGVIFRLP
jgi:hypothetical protein